MKSEYKPGRLDFDSDPTWPPPFNGPTFKNPAIKYDKRSARKGLKKTMKQFEEMGLL